MNQLQKIKSTIPHTKLSEEDKIFIALVHILHERSGKDYDEIINNLDIILHPDKNMGKTFDISNILMTLENRFRELYRRNPAIVSSYNIAKLKRENEAYANMVYQLNKEIENNRQIRLLEHKNHNVEVQQLTFQKEQQLKTLQKSNRQLKGWLAVAIGLAVVVIASNNNQSNKN